jgi:hypothetical protein
VVIRRGRQEQQVLRRLSMTELVTALVLLAALTWATWRGGLNDEQVMLHTR